MHVAISFSGSSTIGETYLLTCSATLIDPVPLPSTVPLPTFKWFVGLNASESLSSGITVVPMSTVTASSSNSMTIIYTSTVQFSPLIHSHAGMYTCQLGAGSPVNSAMVTVNGNYTDTYHYEVPIVIELFYFEIHTEPAIFARITTRLNEVSTSLQEGYSLICSVNGAENINPSISYQWTKNNGTQIQMQTGSDHQIVSFLHFRLSDVGEYTCQATISSPYLQHDTIAITTQHVAIQG